MVLFRTLKLALVVVVGGTFNPPLGRALQQSVDSSVVDPCSHLHYDTTTLIGGGGPEPNSAGALESWKAEMAGKLPVHGPRGIAVTARGVLFVSMRWGVGTVARLDLCAKTKPMYLQPTGIWAPMKTTSPRSAGKVNLDTLAVDPSGGTLYVADREAAQGRCGRNSSSYCQTSQPSWYWCNIFAVTTELPGDSLLRPKCFSTAAILKLPRDSDGVSVYSMAAGQVWLYVGGMGALSALHRTLDYVEPILSISQGLEVFPACCKGHCALTSLHLLGEDTLVAVRSPKATLNCPQSTAVIHLKLGCSGSCVLAIREKPIPYAGFIGGAMIPPSAQFILSSSYTMHSIRCFPLTTGQPRNMTNFRVVSGQECAAEYGSPRVLPYKRTVDESCLPKDGKTWLVNGNAGQSRLYHPYALACFPRNCTGDVFVADQSNNAVRILSRKHTDNTKQCMHLGLLGAPPSSKSAIAPSSKSVVTPTLHALQTLEVTAGALDSGSLLSRQSLRGKWYIFVGDSVLRGLFSAMVEIYIGEARLAGASSLGQSQACLPAWRYQGKGACLSSLAVGCVVDVFAAGGRITFVWMAPNSFHDCWKSATSCNGEKEELLNRADGQVLGLDRLLRSAVELPDAVLVGSGAWFGALELNRRAAVAAKMFEEVNALIESVGVPRHYAEWIAPSWQPSKMRDEDHTDFVRALEHVPLPVHADTRCSRFQARAKTLVNPVCSSRTPESQLKSLCCKRDDCLDQKECSLVGKMTCHSFMLCSGYHSFGFALMDLAREVAARVSAALAQSSSKINVTDTRIIAEHPLGQDASEHANYCKVLEREGKVTLDWNVHSAIK